jgi:hypothetical protein
MKKKETVKTKNIKIWSWALKGAGHQDDLTVGRNITELKLERRVQQQYR